MFGDDTLFKVSEQTPKAAKQPVTSTHPIVVIETSMGTITAELWDDSAPETVKNFLAYVDDKHFDGLIFHRVMRGFMIQGGGFDAKMTRKPTRETIRNEASPDKKNDRGTLAMARTDVIDSATSQFFINLVNNRSLNQVSKTHDGFGYCAFGKVIDGMDIVDKIATVSVGNKGAHGNVPITPVTIKSIRRK
ncbi:MAG: peptidyl-prolyl cis-trans isomerase [bacterium]|nr:peptidyl-prolyl cis-trans isomerase [bacterium]